MLFGMGAQRFIRIGSDRVLHFTQQRQVIQRIAVEGAVCETRKAQRLRFKPVFQAGDLAFAKTGQTRNLPGELAIIVRRLGRDQVPDIEFASDRCSDKTVGGGDDRAQILRFKVALHQRSCGSRYHRQHALAHELLMPVIQDMARMTRQGLKLKLEKFVYIQRSGLVLFIESQSRSNNTRFT
jgi:hypothetical protein